MESKILPDLEALHSEAAGFVAQLSPTSEAATLVTLSGELGAGKTSFTQGMAQALGVSDAVTSPTFVLQKSYALGERGRGFDRLVHLDAYRLQGASDLAPLGFSETLTDSKNLVVLEWPERVAEGLTAPAYAITLAVLPEGGRSITYAQHA